MFINVINYLQVFQLALQTCDIFFGTESFISLFSLLRLKFVFSLHFLNEKINDFTG